MNTHSQRIWKLLQLITGILAVAAAVSGCGPTPQPSQTTLQRQQNAISASLSSLANKGAQSNNQGSSTNITPKNSNFVCPDYNNVNGAAGSFMVCVSQASANSMQVLFSSITAGSFCVFPANNSYYPQCLSVQANTPTVVSFNARPSDVIVTSSTDAAQYVQYLSGMAASPAYSEGLVQ